ncbi:synaptic vesicle glycoprotein 2C-like [Protopterus annectens]|uniref:synaptic vesicle glycoprotein 2C-like n=1 Tax=Protopterus annectens TaxID=7888 RepID=UPI001CFB8A91|nr:synaptic vesicle glycoprotein 2C-like [Protopterus annectens]
MSRRGGRDTEERHSYTDCDREPLLIKSSQVIRDLDTEDETLYECETYRPENSDDPRGPMTYEEAIEKAGFGLFHIMLLFACGWANMSDAVEILCVSFLLPTARCDLHLSTTDMGWLTASVFLGMMIGGYMWGILADRRGRRQVLLFSLALNGIFGTAASLASEFWLFLLLRLISGIGVGGSMPVIFSYFSEFQPRKKRGAMISALATFWMAGNILAAGLAWLVIPNTTLNFHIGTLQFQSWRLFVVLCAIPSVSSVFLFWLLLPESPKFLMELSREEEAIAVFRCIFYWNHRSTRISFPITQLKLSPLVDKEKTSSGYQAKFDCCRFKQGLEPVKKLFTPPLLERSIPFIAIFFSISFGYYGLWMWFPELFKQIEETGGSPCSNGFHSSASKTTENVTCYPVNTSVYIEGFITASSNLPGNLLTILIMDIVGGKILLCSSLLLSGVSVFFIWAVKTKTQSLIMSCFFSAVSVITWNALDVIGTELFPTHLRSSALGFFTGVGRVAAILGNVTFGQLLDVTCAVPILLVSVLLFLGGLISLRLPNTKNVELE